MARDITLVRHGETTANAAGLWQGSGDAGFTDRGSNQVLRVAERLQADTFDRALASGQGRANATAAATGLEFAVDPGWREMGLGSWEGLTRPEVESRYGDELAAMRAGEPVRVGGTGETTAELLARSLEAFDRLAASLDDGQSAVVFSHGGPIMMVVSHLLGVANRGPLHPIVNTAITRITIGDEFPQVRIFNDAGHLNGSHAGYQPGTNIMLMRHGQTVSNVESRWQGMQEGALTDLGREQARRAAMAFPAVSGLYSSPLARALDTAAFIADRHGIPVSRVDELAEMSFGRWENLTTDEIKASFPDEWARFEAGDDLPRGGTGETYDGAGERLAGAVGAIAGRHPGTTVGAVTHGGVSRAFASRILGTGFSERHRLSLLDNTAMAHVVYTDRGPVLAAYNVAPYPV